MSENEDLRCPDCHGTNILGLCAVDGAKRGEVICIFQCEDCKKVFNESC